MIQTLGDKVRSDRDKGYSNRQIAHKHGLSLRAVQMLLEVKK